MAFLVLIAAGVLATNALPPAIRPCPGADTPVAATTLPRFEESVACMINKRRAQHEVQTLEPNPTLHLAAVGYTDSILKGGFFSHHGDFQGRRNTSTVIGRLRDAGYIRPDHVWIVGEDLRWASSPKSTPAQVVKAWMRSPVHRSFLLRWHFDELGVAAVPGYPDDPTDTSAITVTAEFGFRRNR